MEPSAAGQEVGLSMTELLVPQLHTCSVHLVDNLNVSSKALFFSASVLINEMIRAHFRVKFQSVHH